MKKLLLSTLAVAACFGAYAQEEQTVPAQLYLFGNAQGTSFNTESGLEFKAAQPGIFVLENVVMTSETSYFAFVSEFPPEGEENPWAFVNDHRYGPAEQDALFLTGDGDLNEFGLNGDRSWQIPQGAYTFTVDFNNMVAMAEAVEVPVGPGPEIEVPEVLYLIGDVTGWSQTEGIEMTKVSDTVFAVEDVELPGDVNSYFVFASELGSWDVINSHRFSPNTKDAPFDLEGANDVYVNLDFSWMVPVGTYNLYVNFETMKAATTEAAGVKTIGTNLNGEEVIYNLQGVRVNRANMVPGIYVVNGKKVVIR
ncbi:MAG: hypothetical protein J1F12_07940 [Muribaculaceae bacterium]|nr:hypothetical protein [Muribaculaceae bacterium]